MSLNVSVLSMSSIICYFTDPILILSFQSKYKINHFERCSNEISYFPSKVFPEIELKNLYHWLYSALLFENMTRWSLNRSHYMVGTDTTLYLMKAVVFSTASLFLLMCFFHIIE